METVDPQGKKIQLRNWSLADSDELSHWLHPGHRWQELDAPYYKSTTAEDIPGIIARIRARIETGNVSVPRQNLVIAEAAHNRMIGKSRATGSARRRTGSPLASSFMTLRCGGGATVWKHLDYGQAISLTLFQRLCVLTYKHGQAIPA